MSAACRILPVFVPHLGCPHACVFCNQREITGADAEKAMESLRELLREADGEAELAFYGGSFTAIPAEEQERLLSTAREALNAGRIRGIRVSTRPDAIDGARLARLKKAGVSTIELGAQSMQDEVLALSGRGHSPEDVRRASGEIRKEGFSLVLQMMTGLPGDDDEGALETARALIALRPDAVRIYPTVIVRGTALEQMWREGRYREHTVEDAVRVCAELLPLFEAAGIPVIRLGLNPTDELSRGAALAGAYHPALGELVRSRVLRNRVCSMIGDTDLGGRVLEIEVSENRRSQLVGQKKCNLAWLKERYRPAALKVAGTKEPEVLLVRISDENGAPERSGRPEDNHDREDKGDGSR